MRKTAFVLALGLCLFACTKKDVDPPVTPPAVVDNGPIGGTYKLSGITSISYDTIPGNGINTINEYNTTTSNHAGSLTITAGTISSKGLMYDYTRTGTKKEVNTANGATVTTNYTPATGKSGNATATYSSNYTLNATTGMLTVNDAQYLFDPAFQMLPANKLYAYNLTGATLKITTAYYDAANKLRTVTETTFTKQ